MIIVLIYLFLGYWASGVVIYENKIVFHRIGELFLQKLLWGAILGWILIPIAVLKRIFFRR